MSDCAWTEERLPLLHYADEALDTGERRRVEAHLAECEGCRDALGAIEGAAGALSAVPEAVDRDRLAAAMAEVRRAIGCSREADLVEGGDAVDRDHVEACPVCRVAQRELEQLARALDRVTVPALTDAQRERLRAGLAAQLQVPSGRVIRLRAAAWVGRAAAAVLLATTLGLLGAGLARPDDPTLGFAAAELQARTGAVDAAYERFAAIGGRRSTAPARYQRLIDQAHREAEALEHLRHRSTRGGSPSGTTAPASQEAAPYREVVVRYPETLASLEALRRLLAEPGAAIPYRAMVGDQRLAAFAGVELSGPEARERVLRYQYEELAQWIDPKRVTDPQLRQAALLQRGLHAEALGEVVVARGCYQEALAIDGYTAAARVARERLATLG